MRNQNYVLMFRLKTHLNRDLGVLDLILLLLGLGLFLSLEPPRLELLDLLGDLETFLSLFLSLDDPLLASILGVSAYLTYLSDEGSLPA